MAGHGIVFQRRLYFRSQAVEAISHIGDTGNQPNFGPGRYPASSERYQLTDIDGEDAFIRIGSIAMVRVLLDAMKPVEEDDE